MSADGTSVRPPSFEVLGERVRLAVAEGVQAFAISLINSHANKAHEDLIAEWLCDQYPSVAVTTGSSVVAEIGEFERTSTAVLNAYLQPVMSGYLQRLTAALAAVTIDAPILVMQSSGGMLPISEAAEMPVRLLESGPAAGVLAAARVAEMVGERSAVGFDMGGTTAKASLIEDFNVSRSGEFDIGSDISSSSRLLQRRWVHRPPAGHRSGRGRCGRGEHRPHRRWGSVARGARQCRGRARPGVLRPRRYSADRHRRRTWCSAICPPSACREAGVVVDVALAQDALATHIAGPLGITVEDAALAVHAVADQQMARVLRSVTTERGRDLRSHALIVFGGSGGLHAASLANAVRIERVIVPPLAGVLSAVGMLWAPVQLDATITVLATLDERSLVGIDDRLAEVRSGLCSRLVRAGFPKHDFESEVTLDLRYLGQATDLSVPVDGPVCDQLPALQARFHECHREAYGHGGDGAVEVVRARVAVTCHQSAVVVQADQSTVDEAKADEATKAPASRHVRFDVGVVAAPVLNRADLVDSTPGPFLIDEADTTVVVPPGWASDSDWATPSCSIGWRRSREPRRRDHRDGGAASRTAVDRR